MAEDMGEKTEQPTSRRRLHQVFSFMIAFEVVLEKRRGRRY